MLDQIFLDLFLGYIRIMLRRDQNGINSLYLMSIIFYSNLGFTIRSQIRQGSVLTNIRQSLSQLMCIGNRSWHQFRSFIAGIAEHQSLVSCTDRIDGCFICQASVLVLQGFINTHCNIAGLFIDCGQDCTGIAVKTIIGSVITNVQNYLSYELRDIYIARG